MKTLSKIFGVMFFFSLVMAVCASAEETKTEESQAMSAEAMTPPAPPPMAETVKTPVVSMPAEKTTLDNLQAAFNGESNANARYLAFAKKAEAEGYGKVASLFRAAARAEQVHFEWHAKVIKEMGATPTANIETPVVKSTQENLQAALKGETYESTIMYPEFLAKAEKDQNQGAIDAFEDAKAAEAVHASLYGKALKNLKSWKGSSKNFYVCPVCGNVAEKLNFKECPICGNDKSKFLTVR